MQVINPNNVKIYNLSAGRSLPEWLTDKKKRSLQNNDVDVQRRIELIQDFEMPTVSNCVQVSKDGHYIFAAGVYKPRLRCYDVSQLSMKFERCMDSEVVKMLSIADDYSKLVFLQSDRFIEFHAQHGRYYRIRIPKHGRDLAYHSASCDLYLVGTSSEIYRLNLEQGRFLNSLKTKAVELNCCEFNPVHQLFACGTKEGHVECWDPRSRSRVGLLDCALGSIEQDTDLDEIPSVTALKFKDALNMAVGTSTGQVLLYDIRSDKPLLVKDHMYGLPIRDVNFHHSLNLVLSCDTRILKLWHADTGKAFTSIEPGTKINNLCVVPDTGMLFMANEAPKILTYYVPALGCAPKWCSFLDSLTEELEENPAPSVYDDYKFVTRTELDTMGLTHLIGSSLLRAYMHGFFMDIRLYHKAKSLAEPFAYEEYRRAKIRDKIDEERANRVKIKKLPKVNRLLAEKLMEQEEAGPETKKRKKTTSNLLKDDRFAKMFSDPSFQVDAESEEYRLLNPLVSKLDKDRQKRQKKVDEARFDEVDSAGGDSSSDDEHSWTAEMKKQHKKLRDEERDRKREKAAIDAAKPQFYELKTGASSTTSHKDDSELRRQRKAMKQSLGERVESGEKSGMIREQRHAFGNMEMSFKMKKNEKLKRHEQEAKEHHAERKKLRRSAGNIAGRGGRGGGNPQSKFWMKKHA